MNSHRNYAFLSFISCGLLALLSFLPSIVQNGVFLARDDFFNQQIPFILQSKRLLLENGLYQWDWTSYLGTDFLTSYAFYNLGSPFFWILLPLPESATLWGIGVAAILKHAVAGIGSYLFFSLFLNEKRWAFLSSLLYVFSGFTIVNVDFNHFTDVIALFPLWLWQLERTLRGNGKIYSLALWTLLNILTNYYFAVGSFVFIGIYLVLRKQRGPELRHVLMGLGTGLLLAGFWLIPIAVAMLDSPRMAEHNLLLRLFKPLYPTNYLERLRVFLMPIESTTAHPYFPKTYSWKSTAIFLPVLGSVFAALYTFRRRRDWIANAVLFLFIASFVPPLTGIFSLGTNPDYTRWWYILALFLALATARILDSPPMDLARKSLWLSKKILLLALLLCLPVLLFNKFYLADMISLPVFFKKYLDFCYTNSIMGSSGLVFVSLGLTALNYSVLFFLLRRFLHTGSFPYRLTLCGIALCAVANYALVQFWHNNALYPAGEIPDYGQAYYQSIFVANPPTPLQPDTIRYRIDHVPSVENFGALVGMPAIQAFHSVRSQVLSRFVELNGMGLAQSPAARPHPADSALRSLLSVAWFQRFDALNPDSLEPFPHRLPLGFAYRYRAAEPGQRDSLHFLSERLLAALHLPAGSELERLLPPARESHFTKPWQAHVYDLQQDTCSEFSGTAHGFSARCDFDEARVVFFSVPYGPGWKATSNGNPLVIQRAQIAFQAVSLPAGRNQLEFAYTTPGSRLGLGLSNVGIILLLLLIGSDVFRSIRAQGTSRVR